MSTRTTRIGMVWLLALPLAGAPNCAGAGDDDDTAGGAGGEGEDQAGAAGAGSGGLHTGGASGASSGAGGIIETGGSGAAAGENAGGLVAGGAAGFHGLAGAPAGSGGEAGGPSSPLQIVTKNLPDARYAIDYRSRIAVSGGAPGPYGFQVLSGSLPEGVALGQDGTIAGRPKAEGSFPLQVRVTDSEQQQVVASFDLTVYRHRWLSYIYDEQMNEVPNPKPYLADTSRSGVPAQVLAEGGSFSPGGRWLSSSGRRVVDLSKAVVGAFVDVGVSITLWSPHSRWLVGSEGGQFAVLDPARPDEKLWLPQSSTCQNFQFSPGDARLSFECSGTVYALEPGVDLGPHPLGSGAPLGWISDDLLAFETGEGKLAYERFGSSLPGQQPDLLADDWALVATSPTWQRAVFRDASEASDVLFDFVTLQALPVSPQMYSPQLTWIARWQSGVPGSSLEVLPVSNPGGVPTAVIAAQRVVAWSPNDKVLVTVKDGTLQLTWLDGSGTIKSLAAPNQAEPVLFGPGEEWVFLGPYLAMLNVAQPTAEPIDPQRYDWPWEVAPNHERVVWSRFSGETCVADVTPQGLGPAYCPSPFFDELSSFSWAGDSTFVAFDTRGEEATPFLYFPRGLFVLDAAGRGNSVQLVEGFHGRVLVRTVPSFVCQP